METSNWNYMKCCENNLPIACLLLKVKYVNLSLFTLCLVTELTAPLGGPTCYDKVSAYSNGL